jgi:transcriptional regulator with XRE-family HTH domain
MSDRGLFTEMLAEWDRDPEFVLEGVLLGVNERICEVMQEKGISRTQLADRLGKSRQYVTKLLNGKPNVTLSTLVQIAIALGEGLDIFIPSSAGEARNRALRAHEAEQRQRRVVRQKALWRAGVVATGSDPSSGAVEKDEPNRTVAIAS